MTGERDAEHLPRLPLVPVRAGVDGHPALDHQRVGDVGLQRHGDVALQVADPGEQLEPRLTARVALPDRVVALGRRLRRVVLAPAERRRHPVDGRQEAEVVEAERSGSDCRRHATRRSDAQPQVVARLQVRVDEGITERVAELVDDAGAQAVARQRGSLGRDDGVTQSYHTDDNGLTSRRRRSASCPRRASGRPCPRS